MDLPENQPIFRYRIELRDRRDGSMRDLPLQALKKIHLQRKKGASWLPAEVTLQLKDRAQVMETQDIDDLAAQLRRKYPDETFERFLRHERDWEAEKRKSEAMERLIEILAQAALDDLMREQEGMNAKPSRESCGDTRVMRKQRRSKRS
jgi:hypothetical protein